MVLRTPPPVPWFDPYREEVQVRAALSGGSTSVADEYRALRAFFGPTVDRSVWDGGDGNRQDSFKAIDHDWIVTYDQQHDRNTVWVRCPPSDIDQARAAVGAAAAAIGYDIAMLF